MALRFVYLALCKDEAATIGRRVGMDGRNNQKGLSQRRIKFLTSVDPVRAAAVVADSDPASTLVISVALAGEEESSMATRTLQNWLLTNLGGHGRRKENILSKHMMLVTGNEQLAATQKPESVFLIPSHSRCEPFTTFTAASLLPLSIVFGWPIVDEFLAGAHDMDRHFVETNPRHNLPVLLALTDIWNDCMSSHNNTSNSNAGRIVVPFTEAFAAYPAFVAGMESQVCGRKHSPTSVTPQSCASIVIDGGLHGIYDRSVYQSPKVIPSELVMTLDSQLTTNANPIQHQQHQPLDGSTMEDVYQAQDAFICSLFAHADGLAFGSSDHPSPFHHLHHDSPMADNNSLFDEEESSNGNRPCTLLLCGKLDAFTCGQFVAMGEHRAIIKAWICEIDPFPKDVGISLRSKRAASLKESLEKMVFHNQETGGDEDEERAAGNSDLNLSTKTILQHYANLYRDKRVSLVTS
jgi:glucose-6-phosphate isomerase